QVALDHTGVISLTHCIFLRFASRAINAKHPRPLGTWDVWLCCSDLQAEERQRVDSGGCSRRRVQTSAEGAARVQPHDGIETAEQRAQGDVPEWRHERVGDGVG